MKRSKKVFISAVLTATLAFSMAPMAFAASKSSTPVIDNVKKTVSVTNADELAWISEYSNGAGTADMPANFSKWTIFIKNDIDFNSTWTPIKNFHGKMDGVAEGNGYVTISGLKVNTADNAALCGEIAYGGGDKPVFTDIRIADSDFYSKGAYAGAFVGNGYTAEFTNCHVANTTISATRFVGGIAGITYGKITDCSVTGATSITARGTSLILKTGDNAGGIVGLMGEVSCAVANCTVSGTTVTGARQVGGIAGLAQYGNKVDGCTVSDSTIKSVGKGVSVADSRACAGGFVGQFGTVGTQPKIIVTNNTLNGKVDISAVTGGTEYVGWAIGDANSRANSGEYDVSGNMNNGATSGLKEIGH